MNPNTVNNTFVFTEPTGPHPKPPHAPGYPTGKATSILATIKHECAVTPNPGSPEYREIMRERTLEANKKGGRHVQILGDNNKGADGAGGRGGMFLPGMGVRNGFIVSEILCLFITRRDWYRHVYFFGLSSDTLNNLLLR